MDNGDNPPLAISGVQLLSVERRVYFDPQGKSLLRLYYGDSKLESPVYDYAKFFKADPTAAKQSSDRALIIQRTAAGRMTVPGQSVTKRYCGWRCVGGGSSGGAGDSRIESQSSVILSGSKNFASRNSCEVEGPL